jgi:hypothetical protein
MRTYRVDIASRGPPWRHSSLTLLVDGNTVNSFAIGTVARGWS